MLARLVPEPEPENIYDSGAIAVYIMSAELDSYDKVGYIAKEFTCYVHLASKTHTSEYLLKPFASEQLF